MLTINGLSFTRHAKGFLAASLLATPFVTQAGAYQDYVGLAYSNPAQLHMVKNVELIGGGNELFIKSTFNGSFAGVTGSAQSNTDGFLPYARFAYRLNPKVVFGIDLTQPIYSNSIFPANSLVSSGTIDTILRDTDISPKMSYQVTDDLALALGFNVNYLYSAILSFSAPPYGVISNHGNALNYGYNLGLAYTIRRGTYFGLSYYSSIAQNLDAESTWGPLTSSNTSINVYIPALISANLTQFVSQKWLFDATIRYAFWSPFKNLILQNTALPGSASNILIPQNYFNAFDYNLATKYNVTDKFAGIAFVEYTPNTQNTLYRGIGLPCNNTSVVGFALEYLLLPGLTGQASYAYVYAKPPIDTIYPAGRAVGNINFVGNALGFRLTYSA